MTRAINIIYQDDYLLVIDKPPGLVVDTAETVKGETLIDWLQNYYGRLEYHTKDIPERMGIVHRLDKDTSGILLVAKTQEALKNLQKQFKERKVKKEYLALVHGLVTESGRIDAAIIRNPDKREKFMAVASQTTSGKAREAVTEYEPVGNFQFSISRLRSRQVFNFQSIFNDLSKIQMRKLERQRYNEFTQLRCKPKTGRTHQIRVHLKYISHPIVADEKYVGRKMYRLDKRWCPRMFLHASKLGFRHPATGEWMELESRLPEDLQTTIEKLDVRD